MASLTPTAFQGVESQSKSSANGSGCLEFKNIECFLIISLCPVTFYYGQWLGFHFMVVITVVLPFFLSDSFEGKILNMHRSGGAWIWKQSRPRSDWGLGNRVISNVPILSPPHILASGERTGMGQHCISWRGCRSNTHQPAASRLLSLFPRGSDGWATLSRVFDTAPSCH